MALDLLTAASLTDAQLKRLGVKERSRLQGEWAAWVRADHQANALGYYRPVNDAAAQLHASVSREIGIQGGNKCQPGGTRVLTERGVVPIAEIKAGDVVLASGRKGVVVGTYESPTPVAVYRVVTKRGYVMHGSPEHPVMMAAPGPRAWHGSQYVDAATARWVELVDARPGDYIRLMYLGAFPDACEIEPDDAYFLGLMTGDGSWCGPTAAMSLTTADAETIAWACSYLARRGVHTWVGAKKGRAASSVEWCRKPFKALLAAWGVEFHRSTEKRVPEIVWRGTHEVVAAFLRGYADSDGCATTKPSVVWTSASEALLVDVQKLLLRFAIVASRHACAPNGRFRSWRLEVTGRSASRYAAEIGFMLVRKAARLPPPPVPGKPQWTKWDRVVSVDRVADEVVHGLTVSPTPLYEADGFLQHNSGKTATALAEAAIQMTGIIPASLTATYPRRKLHPPIRVRLVVTSLTSAWDVNLKLKLQHWEWSGRPNGDDLMGDPDFGHWGFIPPSMLLHGEWMASWSERHRVLTLTNGSTLQVMAHEQNLQDFNQGAFDLIVEDEIPPEDVHRANRLRVMERGGQLLTGGTPSDDRANVAAGWFFDQILAPGLERGDPADPEVFAVVLWTEHNRTLDPANIDFVAKGLTAEQRRARLHGEAIHLGGLIFPGFQDRPAEWCFRCQGKVRLKAGVCPEDGGTDVTGYSHVWDAEDLPEVPRTWPVLFYMDPHQARETACAWVAVDPSDNWWVLAEREFGGDARAVKDGVEALEAERGWTVLWRKGDPKITVQTNQFAREFQGEAFTIRRAFEDVGFFFDEANTNFTVARDRVLQAFPPNPYTRAPRLRVHESCRKLRYQMTHFVWLDRGRRDVTATKEQPSRSHSDFPALMRYLAADDPTWAGCQSVRHATPIQLGRGAGRSVIGW